MKKIITTLGFAVLLIACTNSRSYQKYAEVENPEEDYAIIPLPQEMETSNGVFIIDENTKIHSSE